MPTTIATPKIEPDDEADPVDTVTATPVSTIAPWPPNKPRTEPAPPDSGFGFDDASVPVCTPQGAPPATLKLDPQYVRTIVTTAVGVIPDVGKPLSALVQALWKDKTSDSMFDQMKDYVEKLVPELLTKDFQARLGEHLTGINNVLENYKDAEPEDKTTYLINLQNAVDLFEPLFLGKGYPADRTIAHFGAFGALKLAVLKELVEHARGPHKRAQQKKLDRKIAEYREHVARIKDELTTKRLSVLKVEHNCTGYRVGRHSRTVCHETAVDPSCNWSGPDRGEDQRAATADLANRREQVRQAYNASLDAVLEPVTRLAAALEREAAASAAATPKP